MRQVTVFVNDYEGQKRSIIGFSNEDYDKVDSQWNVEDGRLLALQHVNFFKGRKCWSDLQTEHYRFLIHQTMPYFVGMTDAERLDQSHPANLIFNFLILSMIRCIEIATGSTIELMHINRVTQRDINFDYTAIMDLNFGPPSTTDNNPFKIIVDNTK